LIIDNNDPKTDWVLHPNLKKLSCYIINNFNNVPDFSQLTFLSLFFEQEYTKLEYLDITNLKVLSLKNINLKDFQFRYTTTKLKELHVQSTFLDVTIIPTSVEYLYLDDLTVKNLVGLKAKIQKLYLNQNCDLQSLPITVTFLTSSYTNENQSIPAFVKYYRQNVYENFYLNPNYKKFIIGISKFQKLFRRYYYGGIRIDTNKMI